MIPTSSDPIATATGSRAVIDASGVVDAVAPSTAVADPSHDPTGQPQDFMGLLLLLAGIGTPPPPSQASPEPALAASAGTDVAVASAAAPPSVVDVGVLTATWRPQELAPTPVVAPTAPAVVTEPVTGGAVVGPTVPSREAVRATKPARTAEPVLVETAPTAVPTGSHAVARAAAAGAIVPTPAVSTLPSGSAALTDASPVDPDAPNVAPTPALPATPRMRAGDTTPAASTTGDPQPTTEMSNAVVASASETVSPREPGTTQADAPAIAAQGDSRLTATSVVDAPATERPRPAAGREVEAPGETDAAAVARPRPVVRLVPASGRRASVATDDAGTGERPTSGEARAIAERAPVDGREQVDGRLMSPAFAIASSPPPIEAPRAAAEVAGSRAVAEPPIVDQVVQTARLVVTDGLTHMEVQLDPPTLGTVRVTAAASGDGIQLTIAAEQADTRALLLQAIPEIQSALSARGVAAAAVAVSHTFDQPEGRRAPARRETERESRFAHTPGERRRERSAPSRPVATVDFTV